MNTPKPLDVEQRIAEIRERCAKASAAPWLCVTEEYDGANWLLGYSTRNGKSYYVTTDHVHGDAVVDPEQDGAFIAHARADVEWLLAQLLRVTAERDELRRTQALPGTAQWSQRVENPQDSIA